MALTRTVEESTGVPKGVYIARIKELVEDDGQFGAQIKFIFQIKEVLACDAGEPEDWINEEKWAWAKDVLTPNSKLFKWSKQILGGELDIGDPIDLDQMVGKMVRLTVGESKHGNLTVTDVAAHRPKKNGKSKPKAEPEYDEFEEEEAEEDFD